MPKYLTSFNLAWLKDERFEFWLGKSSMPTKAFCKICAKSFDISNMGERALTSHMKSSKHQHNVKVGSQCLLLTSVFKTKTATLVKPSAQLVTVHLQSSSESSLIQAPETKGFG
ncbi:Serine/threonine-protein kinase SMG1 [Biomphalaria glabrata]|nr:Serine/threonine-protein kinase SMG1 [Biomphalaria glabrata]